MNDHEETELLALEAELATLRPRRVQPELMERIQRALAGEEGIHGDGQEAGVSVFQVRGSAQDVSAFAALRAAIAPYGQLAAAALLVFSSALLYWISRDAGVASATPGTAMAASSTSSTSAASAASADDMNRHQPSWAGANSAKEGNSAKSADGWQPVGTTSRLTRPNDAGVIIEEGQPFRILQFQLEEEQRYTNPEDGSSIKVQRPRTEQLRIPLHVM